jgi:hypothetical protein
MLIDRRTSAEIVPKNTAKLLQYQALVQRKRALGGVPRLLRLRGEMGEDGVRELRANHLGQLLAGGAAHTGHASKRGQQRLTASWTDARYGIQLRLQITFGPREPMEGDGKPMRLVADALNQQERRAFRRERDRVLAIAGEQQFLFLRDANRHEAAEPQLLECRVGG